MEKEFWKDYFDSLGKVIQRLGEVLHHPKLRKIDYLQDAAIQRFEFCTELYWKVLKKFLAYEEIETTTPKDVLQKAYQFKLIDDEKIWLKMIHDRNRTSHVYKQEEAQRIFENILTYWPILESTYDKLKIRLTQE
jgi:nucleotidyltransferase substrate binding protein (TIGR01987 family)